MFSARGPSERAQDLLRQPIPPPSFTRKIRERLNRALRDGGRSILSPYDDRRRWPLWSGTFWSEIYRMLEIRDQYDQVRKWLDANQTPRSAPLIPRLYEGWKKFNWSELDSDLKADDPTAHLPQPDRLLPILSNQWIEDDLMDLLVRLTSLNMKSRPVPPGLVVPLRFWRELVHLYENDGFFDEMHYPCLSETWLTVKSGNLDVGFIVNDAKPLPGDQGTHWTACVLSVSTGEYRFGDSLDAQPPLLLQPALELWLARCNALPPGAQLRRGNDLDHASQTDGWSCGIIAVNTLEHHFLDYPLWGPNKNADIRITKYINLLEYNRGAPLPPPRSRASSVSTDASQRSRSRTRTLSTRPDVYFGDIPVEGQDLAVLRAGHPKKVPASLRNIKLLCHFVRIILVLDLMYVAGSRALTSAKRNSRSPNT
ncbi:uncharacterized protein EI90DRAFT_432455 [Cantharellus anzutake]|uniref:uncharacterized protein n=1 Tax=Cantharellus anzutake TaxID=1750568 RepID=UPI001906BEC9|nr:uncharacterized protein EI90DRAFT_432455 [Cantharellus anzutake]KAF8314579.1 hypothetical protein EI90DRAFT_432455 [Cantharellus anzutake]